MAGAYTRHQRGDYFPNAGHLTAGDFPPQSAACRIKKNKNSP